MNRNHTKSVRILLFFAILLYLGGCDFIYGILQKEGAEEKSILGEIVPLTPNSRVRDVQEYLSAWGYKVGKADGVLGARTREILERFQKENGLKSTRFVDKKTWERLELIKEANLVLNGEINVATLQAILKEAGFYQDKADGKMGPKSQEALKNFQKANGLSGDGLIGPATVRKFIDYLSGY